MKRYHHGHRLQFYMYYFMYMFPETMVDEEYFPETTSFFFENYNKNSTHGPVPNNWLGFSYICL